MKTTIFSIFPKICKTMSQPTEDEPRNETVVAEENGPQEGDGNDPKRMVELHKGFSFRLRHVIFSNGLT